MRTEEIVEDKKIDLETFHKLWKEVQGYLKPLVPNSVRFKVEARIPQMYGKIGIKGLKQKERNALKDLIYNLGLSILKKGTHGANNTVILIPFQNLCDSDVSMIKRQMAIQKTATSPIKTKSEPVVKVVAESEIVRVKEIVKMEPVVALNVDYDKKEKTISSIEPIPKKDCQVSLKRILKKIFKFEAELENESEISFKFIEDKKNMHQIETLDAATARLIVNIFNWYTGDLNLICQEENVVIIDCNNIKEKSGSAKRFDFTLTPTEKDGVIEIEKRLQRVLRGSRPIIKENEKHFVISYPKMVSAETKNSLFRNLECMGWNNIQMKENGDILFEKFNYVPISVKNIVKEEEEVISSPTVKKPLAPTEDSPTMSTLKEKRRYTKNVVAPSIQNSKLPNVNASLLTPKEKEIWAIVCDKNKFSLIPSEEDKAKLLIYFQKKEIEQKLQKEKEEVVSLVSSFLEDIKL